MRKIDFGFFLNLKKQMFLKNL